MKNLKILNNCAGEGIFVGSCVPEVAVGD